MSAKAGKRGKVQLGTNVVAEIKSWQADISADMEETSVMNENWKRHTPTLLGGEGSADCNWAVATDTNGQAALQSALLAGTTVALRLYVDETRYYSGNAFVSNLSIKTESKGIVEATFDFVFDGPVTFV